VSQFGFCFTNNPDNYSYKAKKPNYLLTTKNLFFPTFPRQAAQTAFLSRNNKPQKEKAASFEARGF